VVFEAKPAHPGWPTAYVYRVDLRKLTEHAECLAGLVVNFGPAARMLPTSPTSPHLRHCAKATAPSR